MATHLWISFTRFPHVLCLTCGDLFSFLSLCLPCLPLVSTVSKTLPSFYLFILFVPLLSLSPVLFIMRSHFLPNLPLYYLFPPPVSQLPGETASHQARVWCCPMCTAERADPRSGGGLQGARGGHGVRTEGSRNGDRGGMIRGHFLMLSVSMCVGPGCILL